jgi:hypothetical protein
MQNRIGSLLTLLAFLPVSVPAAECVEYLRKEGTTSGYPYVKGLTKEQLKEIQARAKDSKTPKSEVAVPPVSREKGDYTIELFPGFEKEAFRVYGLKGPREYLRPNLPEFEGYVKKIIKDATDVKATAPEKVSQGHFKTYSHVIQYGMDSTPAGIIRLEMNEEILGLVSLGDDSRLAITSRLDRKIGFQTKSAGDKPVFTLEVYLLQPTGHTFIGFHVPAGDAAVPAIKVTQHGEKDVVLSVDSHDFLLTLEPFPQPGAGGAPN